MSKVYACLDIRCFYASLECIKRGLDPNKTALVVADAKKGESSVCLAVSPYMRKLGIKGRPRLFQIKVDYDFIKAKPMMEDYLNTSLDIYEIYLSYFSKDDIYVYSIDEVFIDLTSYLNLYNLSAEELIKKVINSVYKKTKLEISCGIGSNLFLAKVALDIMAKKSIDNVYYLTDECFNSKIKFHTPITDIWQIGEGIKNRLYKLGLFTLNDISLCDEKILYKEFGVNALHLIEHSKGIEPTTITDIKNYKSHHKTLSTSQIVKGEYNFYDSILLIKEMSSLLIEELIKNNYITNSFHIYIRYTDQSTFNKSNTLLCYESSYSFLFKYITNFYEENFKTNKYVKKIVITMDAYNIKGYNHNLLSDLEKEKKEKNIILTIDKIKEKYGKNSILKGMNIEKKATTRYRNTLLGGHNAK